MSGGMSGRGCVTVAATNGAKTARYDDAAAAAAAAAAVAAVAGRRCGLAMRAPAAA